MGLLLRHVERGMSSLDGRKMLMLDLNRSQVFSPREVGMIVFSVYPIGDDRPVSDALRDALMVDALEFAVGADLLPAAEVSELATLQIAKYRTLADALGERAYSETFSELLPELE